MALSLITAPKDEPLDLTIAKTHLKTGATAAEDALLRTVYIPAVRDRGELCTGRAFITQTMNPYGYPAKDRSGQLDLLEPPDLRALIEKCAAATQPKNSKE